MNSTVEVHVDYGGRTLYVGRAYFNRSKKGVTTSFNYDPQYLSADTLNFDPSLVLDPGSQYQEGLFGAFADSAPDRWGRTLIEKAERVRAREERRAPRSLDDVDYLLGVSDETRQGALRFRAPNATHFLGDHASVPALIELPRLLNAANNVESNDDSLSAVKDLLDTGTTGLGGARPKASVRLADGSLAIAKFPHGSDRWNVMAWEATALDLLDRAGVRTPRRNLVRVGESAVLVLRRFDRGSNGERLAYISAMTATRARDGDHLDYHDIFRAMRDISFDLPRDSSELFDRIIASVALGNTDDHLRNHGFLAHRNQWRLSPVFDVNPHPDVAKRRSTTIAGADRPEDEVEGLLALADGVGLGVRDARESMDRVARALADWKDVARDNGIAGREIEMMAVGIEPRLRNVAAGAARGAALAASAGPRGAGAQQDVVDRAHCGKPVAATGRPCILRAGHRGKCRSR